MLSAHNVIIHFCNKFCELGLRWNLGFQKKLETCIEICHISSQNELLEIFISWTDKIFQKDNEKKSVHILIKVLLFGATK